ncbi:sulfatase [Planctomycetota bacterium]
MALGTNRSRARSSALRGNGLLENAKMPCRGVREEKRELVFSRLSEFPNLRVTREAAFKIRWRDSENQITDHHKYVECRIQSKQFRDMHMHISQTVLTIWLVSIWLVSICSLANGVENTQASQPNFVLFLTDDISQDDLGCYGNPDVKTPHLDQWAADGLRFTNAYLTCSSCSPSRCSLITGRFPHNTGAAELHTQLPPNHVLFPKLLKDAGYYTVLSGKHHMGPHANGAFDKVSPGRGPGKEGDWIEILQNRPRDKPFFCWFASGDAHRDWQSSDDAPTYDADSIKVPPFLVNGPLTRQDLASYYHEVSRTDTFAGRIRDELKSQGIERETYFIYMSDNGRPFPRCKTRVYDSGVKSPLIIARPGTIKPNVTESLVSVNVDLPATILQLAKVDQSNRMQGVSFASILKNPTAKVRDFVFSEHNWHVNQAYERMVRFGDFMYIRNGFPQLQSMCVESAPKFPAGRELWARETEGKLNDAQRDIFQIPRAEEELFVLSTDPHQLKNVVGAPEHANELAKLRSVMDRWIKETRDCISSDPTPDRQSPEGVRNRNWHHRIQPGIEAGSLEANGKGPLRE